MKLDDTPDPDFLPLTGGSNNIIPDYESAVGEHSINKSERG